MAWADLDWRIWSNEKECRRLARELRARLPVFAGYRLKPEGRFLVVDIHLDPGPWVKKIRPTLSASKALVPYVKDFLGWELRKFGRDTKCRLWPGKGNLRCDIKQDRGAPSSGRCECCGKQSANLRHFTDYRCNEVLCDDCYDHAARCMDN